MNYSQPNGNFNSEFYSMSSTGIIHMDPNQQILQDSQATQLTMQYQQILQIDDFVHFEQYDNNFYHVTCKILQEDSNSLNNYNHDYEFVYQYPNNPFNYHVTCKLLSCLLIEDVLNREFCKNLDINHINRDLEVNYMGRKELTLIQKHNLEQDLKERLFQLMQRQILEKSKCRHTCPFHRNVGDHMMTEPIVSDNNLDGTNGFEGYTENTYNDCDSYQRFDQMISKH